MPKVLTMRGFRTCVGRESGVPRVRERDNKEDRVSSVREARQRSGKRIAPARGFWYSIRYHEDDSSR